MAKVGWMDCVHIISAPLTYENVGFAALSGKIQGVHMNLFRLDHLFPE